MGGFELQPRLMGELIELRPLVPDDWEALFESAADPLLWQQHPAHDRWQEPVFREFFREALASGGAFAIVDRRTQQIIGSSRYAGFDPQQSEIEIGWTFLARPYWGGLYNAELKRLMLEHAFRFVDSVVFLVGETNVRSRKALEKIGATLTDRHEQRVLHSGAVDHVVYRITKASFVRLGRRA